MLEPLIINETVTIPPQDLSWEATRSSGPGGQNVNKVASKVELRFDFWRTRALDAETKARLCALAAGRLDAAGRILIVSQLTRDQGRNLLDALEKLKMLVLRALRPPKARKPTRPTRASRERRIADKRQHGTRKKERRGRNEEDPA